MKKFDLKAHVRQLPIEGSEAQIKWAKSIRNRKTEDLMKLYPAGILRLMKAAGYSDAEFTAAGADSDARYLSVLTDITLECLSETKSSWWISNNGEPVSELVVPAARRIFNLYSKARPTFPS